jgi:mRNA interferase HicA
MSWEDRWRCVPWAESCATFGPVHSRQFRNWLAKRGCTFEPKKGGSGHPVVRRGNAKSELPMHGGSKQLGTGLINRIKKDLGLR